jgi:hypothetical protein
MSARLLRAALALLLLAAAFHLPVKTWAATVAAAVLHLAAVHPAVVLVAVAVVLLLRSVPVARLAGRRAARLLAGGGQL